MELVPGSYNRRWSYGSCNVGRSYLSRLLTLKRMEKIYIYIIPSLVFALAGACDKSNYRANVT